MVTNQEFMATAYKTARFNDTTEARPMRDLRMRICDTGA
jgi:hypothetical protein